MSEDKSPKFIPLPEAEEQQQQEQEGIQSSESVSEVPEILSGGRENKYESEADKGVVISTRESEKQVAADGGAEGDGEDGFSTPTSSEHKIPSVTDCPPAPKKVRPQSSRLKRKASHSPPPPGARRRILESDEASTEVESMFRPISGQDSVDDQETKAKKPRMDDDED